MREWFALSALVLTGVEFGRPEGYGVAIVPVSAISHRDWKDVSVLGECIANGKAALPS